MSIPDIAVRYSMSHYVLVRTLIRCPAWLPRSGGLGPRASLTQAAGAVIDRDVMPEIGAHRHGVPQGRHTHILHQRGRQVLDELFPGFTAQVLHAGAEFGDTLGSVRSVLSGYRLRQADIGLPTLFSSRPLLEGQVRARVRALPGITLTQGTDIAGLTMSADRRRVTGAPETIAADLVGDATGRGSRTPVWLPEWGYQPPARDRLEIGLGYATRTYRLRPGALGSDKAILITATPDQTRSPSVSRPVCGTAMNDCVTSRRACWSSATRSARSILFTLRA